MNLKKQIAWLINLFNKIKHLQLNNNQIQR